MNEELKRQAISSFKDLNKDEKRLLKNALDSIVSCYRVIGQENTENEKFLLDELAQFIDALK
ncbi:MAG: hypothetical protein MJZ19_00010 [Paludibacteraceae bacterium]|nr:hypothetical protein [Paludibacteraceae bacterium]